MSYITTVTANFVTLKELIRVAFTISESTMNHYLITFDLVILQYSAIHSNICLTFLILIISLILYL